jgi:hypothetical protein
MPVEPCRPLVVPVALLAAALLLPACAGSSPWDEPWHDPELRHSVLGSMLLGDDEADRRIALDLLDRLETHELVRFAPDLAIAVERGLPVDGLVKRLPMPTDADGESALADPRIRRAMLRDTTPAEWLHRCRFDETLEPKDFAQAAREVAAAAATRFRHSENYGLRFHANWAGGFEFRSLPPLPLEVRGLLSRFADQLLPHISGADADLFVMCGRAQEGADRLTDWVESRDPDREMFDRLWVQLIMLRVRGYDGQAHVDLGRMERFLSRLLRAGRLDALPAMLATRVYSVSEPDSDNVVVVRAEPSFDDVIAIAALLPAELRGKGLCIGTRALSSDLAQNPLLNWDVLKHARPSPDLPIETIVQIAAFAEPFVAMERLHLVPPLRTLVRMRASDDRPGVLTASQREVVRRIQEIPEWTPIAGPTTAVVARLAAEIRAETPAGVHVTSWIMDAISRDQTGAIIPPALLEAVSDVALAAIGRGDVGRGLTITREPGTIGADDEPDAHYMRYYTRSPMWSALASHNIIWLAGVRPPPPGLAAKLEQAVVEADPGAPSDELMNAVVTLAPEESAPFAAAWDRADRQWRDWLAAAAVRHFRDERVPDEVLGRLMGHLGCEESLDLGILKLIGHKVDRHGNWPAAAVSAWLLREPDRLADVIDTFNAASVSRRYRNRSWLTALRPMFAAAGVGPIDEAGEYALRRAIVAAELGIWLADARHPYACLPGWIEKPWR